MPGPVCRFRLGAVLLREDAFGVNHVPLVGDVEAKHRLAADAFALALDRQLLLSSLGEVGECHGEAFAFRLTKQEDRRGLLNDAATIGTRNGWESRLDERGFSLRAQRLINTPG